MSELHTAAVLPEDAVLCRDVAWTKLRMKKNWVLLKLWPSDVIFCNLSGDYDKQPSPECAVA